MSEEYKPMVRPYTKQEKDSFFLMEREKAVVARAIDNIGRYQEAASQHPEKAEHFHRLVAATAFSAVWWAEYYQVPVPVFCADYCGGVQVTEPVITSAETLTNLGV